MERKSFGEGIAEKYTSKQYEYDSLEGSAESFLFNPIKWILKKLGEMFSINLSSDLLTIIENIIYIALLLVGVYIVVRILMGNRATSFFSPKSQAAAPLSYEEEHIQNINLDAYIKKALEEKNYRLAIRYMYLKSLKSLSEKNLIEWNFEKTNADYYNEIKNGELKTNFQKISYWYDHIWYGEFDLNQSGFETAKKDFERLNQKVNYAG